MLACFCCVFFGLDRMGYNHVDCWVKMCWWDSDRLLMQVIAKAVPEGLF